MPLLFVLLITQNSYSATYYIRTDGGDDQQCNGMSDSAYQGSGANNQSCAWSHPFWALNASGGWKLNGGDTLLIRSGSYMMGMGAPNTSGWCSSDSAWDCHLPTLPSGPDAQNQTRLLGAGWDSGCTSPPELWGTQRASYILSLSGTSNAVIDCLELTDHSGCVESHSNTSVACQRDVYPYGEWAVTGVIASDSSSVTLKHLNIHGFAVAGIQAGRLSNWTVEDVKITGNGWVGWDGDIEGSDSNSGTLTFRRWIVEWNGCAESYSDKQPNNCWAQSAGGYGDGVGTGTTGGHWIIDDSIFRYNTSDGLDLLYVREDNSLIEIRRTKAYGNAGNQIKVNGPTMLENSLIVGNCGYFEGKSFTYYVDNCRALGTALPLTLRQGNTVSVVNSTIAGHGDCLGSVECNDSSCNGSEKVIVQNNIFQGYQDFTDSTDTACYFWFDRDNFYQTQMDYNIIYNVKQPTYPYGTNDILKNPFFFNSNLESFDGRLKNTSHAINSGLPTGSLSGLIPSDDITGAKRSNGSSIDRGAYEYANNCVAPLSSDFILQIPSISFSGSSYFADLKYEQSSTGYIMFKVTNAGTVTNPGDFGGCQSSTLSLSGGNYILHIPTLIYNSVSFWADFQYAPTSDNQIWFKLTNAGQN